MEQESWIITLGSELEKISPSDELERQKKCCIYRVPKILRELNRDAYTPQLVSFGPYHHNQDHLKPMEQTKRFALLSYLQRANMTVAALAEAMRPEVKGLMESYDGLEKEWLDEERFLKLMIVDGCFFLDLMVWHTVNFLKPYMTIRLWMDMLRLENQLPLSALAVLIEVGGNKVEDTNKFIKYYLNSSNTKLESIRGMGFHHLDIYRKYVTMVGDYFYDPYFSVRPVTDIFQAGVRFMKSETYSMKDVSFIDGVLRLPHFKVDDNTEPLLLNFLAYEQILNVDSSVTSYAFLMGNLIDTAKDVVVLRKKGIISVLVGSDDDIVSLCNRLTKAMTFSIGKGKENVNKKLNKYCNGRLHEWRASFMQTYLSNPWVFSSLVGAFILLLLTALQTVYAVISYYKRS